MIIIRTNKAHGIAVWFFLIYFKSQSNIVQMKFASYLENLIIFSG